MALSKLTRQSKNLYKLLIKQKPINPHYKNLSTYTTTSITNDLIFIFTKRPICYESSELKKLAPLLNTKIVEAVLNSFKNWKIAYAFFTWASNQFGYKHNIYTYNAMAFILSRVRQNASMKVLVEDLLNSKCFMSPGSLGYFIRCLGDVGLIYEANFLFDQVKSLGLCVHNDYSYNCLLDAFSNSDSNCVDLVEMRLTEMRDQGLCFSKHTLTPVLKVYCNAGKFDEALNVFNEINDHGWVDSYVLSIFVVSFSKWGYVDKAFEFIERMEGLNFKLSEKTFYVMIHGFVKQSRVDKGLELFYKMKKYGFSFDITAFDVLMGGLCSSKELDKALSLYSEMKMLNVRPDIEIVRKLISSFSDERDVIRIFEEMLEDMAGKNRTLLCNFVLSSFVNSCLIDKAYCFLRTMMGNINYDNVQFNQLFQGKDTIGPNTASFDIVINGLVQACKLELAFCLFEDMAKIGIKRDVSIYNNLILGLCKSDRLQESYELLREMEESGFKPTQFTLNSIFGCLCKRGDASGALDLVKKMRVNGHQPWVKHYTLLVKKLCTLWKTTEACKFLTDMAQEGFLPDIIAYSALFGGLIGIQEVDQALKLFRDICARGHHPDLVAHNILIKGLCASNRISEARNIFNEMEMKGLMPSVVTYNLLVDSWSKSGCMDDAITCLSSMNAKGMEPNVITYTILVNGFLQTGKPDDAVLLWNEMRGKGFLPNRVSFMAFIYGLCKCRRPEAALIHFYEMEEKEMEPETYIYTALVNAFLNNSNFSIAFEVLKKMIECRGFPDPPDKNYINIRDAIVKLSEDSRTSSSVKSLVTSGSIPKAYLSDNGNNGEVIVDR